MVTGDEGGPVPANDPDGGAGAERDQLERLRQLLLGRERRALGELERRFDELELTPEELAELLPEAIAVRAASDDQLARALAPTFEKSFQESIERDPERIASAVYPVIGPAVRRALTEALAGLVATINQALEHSLSPRGLRWRIEAWRTGVPFAQIVLRHALVYRVEQVFLIHAETGLLLAHVAHDQEQTQDADLVSAMLTAIRDFVQDSFDPGGDGALRNFSVGELTVMVEAGPRALLAVAVRGQPAPELAERLQQVLESIHFRFPRALQEFDGDAEPFAPARPLLAECLETVLETGSPARRGWTPRVAWAALALALLLGGAWWWRAAQRFERTVAALRAEPGLVVLDAERGVRRARIHGLRDPLARSPETVVREAGGDPSRLEARFEPYLSFDAPLVLARATRVLAPPAGVTLLFEQGRLIARGEATEPWLARAERDAALVSGVATFDASAVSTSLPAEIEEGRRRIEAGRILFGAGSARLSDAASALATTLAAEVLALRAACAAGGYRLDLSLIGRADEIGSEQLNRALSEQRASVVLAALVRGGVPPALLSARGLGTDDPLPAADDATFSRINRSVSFEVRVDRDPPRSGR
ncbi:MAG TPA: OmpA family protein [Thermoanaerobaculia bacterium]|nr:OmpA family protein [Thermoanaerobaculia bacterium]